MKIRALPELAVAAAATVAGLWGYFAFFLDGDVDSQGTGVAILLGAYAVNGLLQVLLAVYVRADLSPRGKLVCDIDSWSSRDGGPTGRQAALAWFGPVAAGLVVMLVATPASTPSLDEDFGIHTSIVLLTLLGSAAVLLGALVWPFAVLPLTALAGVLLPGPAWPSRVEILTRSWLLPVTVGFGTVMTFGGDINGSDLGYWLVDDFGLPVTPAAFLAVLSVAAIVALIVGHQRARARRARSCPAAARPPRAPRPLRPAGTPPAPARGSGLPRTARQPARDRAARPADRRARRPKRGRRARGR